MTKQDLRRDLAAGVVASNQPEPRLLTIDDLCVRWSITRQTLSRWRKMGLAPPVIAIGPSCPRFRLCDVLTIEESHIEDVKDADLKLRFAKIAAWQASQDERADAREAELTCAEASTVKPQEGS